MVLIDVFLKSLQLTSKKAMFALNRVGMDIVMIYLFILVFLVSIPAFIAQLGVSDGLAGQLDFILTVIYFFMFYYLPLTIGILIILSILAYIGTLLAQTMKRKLRYQIIWKLIAFTMTIPFLLYMIISFIYPISDSYLLLAAVYSFILLFVMILKFPKRRAKKKS